MTDAESGVALFGHPVSTSAASQVPPLVLAYVGDAVYELHVRRRLVGDGVLKTKQLHDQAVSLVKAAAQATMLRAVEAQLTPQELAVARRGRNTKTQGVPKGATVSQYRAATGFEALLGYLFLSGQHERAAGLVESAHSAWLLTVPSAPSHARDAETHSEEMTPSATQTQRTES